MCLLNFRFMAVVVGGAIATNGLALGAVANFGAQNCQYTTKVDARYNVQLTTSPAIEPNVCYSQWFLSFFVCRYMFFSTIVFNFCVVGKITITKFVKFFFCS